ncbi:MAG: OmpH family outer membrane protein [Chlamydiae bacterium]|nr:OmpH family outer membrane protein [Chlamydiota bacterium]
MKNFSKIIMMSAFLLASTCGFAMADTKGIGIANFATCMSESKYGKQEQASFESLKKQLSSLLEDTEKQLNEIAAKFNDSDYMDGLSPESEDELKNKFRTLNEELNRYQNQYYQVLNQANMKILQSINAKIQTAADKVAKDKKLTTVINKDACFFYAPNLDVTSSIVTEMDKNFEKEKETAVAEKAEAKAETADAAPVVPNEKVPSAKK